MISRSSKNPIITTKDVDPSLIGLKVIGAFNPGACLYNGEVILLVRVAEAAEPEEGYIKVPVIEYDDEGARLQIKSWKEDGQHSIDASDPRHIIVDGKRYLTSISHLRLARSQDGYNFSLASEPFLVAERRDEAYGVEDGRVVQIDDTYYITYTATSEDGFGVGLASTKDFQTVERLGMMLPPENKDVCFFPEKVGGRYIALHRPVVHDFGKPSIWYAESQNLREWGNNSCLLRPVENPWENQKLGAGPEPFKTPEGWLLLYHGVGDNSVYSLLVCLLDLKDPRRVLKRKPVPILAPEKKYETDGFVPNVTFSNGWVKYPDGRILIYYGASDDSTCVAETSTDELLAFLA